MKLAELELLKQNIVAAANAAKAIPAAQLTDIDTQMATKLAEVDARINVIQATASIRADLKKKVVANSLTKTDYDLLPIDQQQLVRDCILEKHSSDVLDPIKLCTIIEGAVIPAIKVLLLTADRTKLTAEQTTYLQQYETIIQQHPMSITQPDWLFAFLSAGLTDVLTNRAAYATELAAVTGQVL